MTLCGIMSIDAINRSVDSAKRLVARLAGALQPQTVLVYG